MILLKKFKIIERVITVVSLGIIEGREGGTKPRVLVIHASRGNK